MKTHEKVSQIRLHFPANNKICISKVTYRQANNYAHTVDKEKLQIRNLHEKNIEEAKDERPLLEIQIRIQRRL